jgi:hypothetical protein
MTQLAEAGGRVFVLVFSLWTGDPRAIPLEEKVLKGEYSTLDACNEVKARWEEAARSASDPTLRRLAKFRCEAKKQP